MFPKVRQWVKVMPSSPTAVPWTFGKIVKRTAYHSLVVPEGAGRYAKEYRQVWLRDIDLKVVGRYENILKF